MTVAVKAQDGISVDTFKPATTPEGVFQLTLPDTKTHLKWTAGGMVHFGYHVIRQTYSPPDDAPEVTTFPLQYRLQVDLSFAIGLFDWLELGLAVPVIAYQNTDVDGFDLQPAGVGDPRIEARARFVTTDLFHAAAGLTLTAPLGHYASSGDDFMGTRLPTAEPEFIGAFYIGPVIIGLNVGVLFRAVEEEANYRQTQSLTWSAGVAWDVRDFSDFGGIRIGFENNAQMALNYNNLSQLPFEILAGVKYRDKRDLIYTAGAGMGLTDAVGMPLFRVFAGFYFDPVRHNCPAGPEDFDGYQDNDKCVDPDNDGDGFLDEVDKCPLMAEDKDGFKDDDGCLDPDNDSDGIPDVVDQCPLLGEDMDQFEDDDGCPEEGPGKAIVKITDTQLLLSSKIYFDYNSDVINPVSYPILDAVAEALNANPQIKKVRVEGHTDNEGTQEYNKELSGRRAASVVQYLIGKSVQSERLSYEGLGFSVPKASNDTEEGRAINRRVEFQIVVKDEGK